MNNNSNVFSLTIFNNNTLINSNDTLLDEKYYIDIMKYVGMSEDSEGNYNFNEISNVGMVYLFLHQKGKRRSNKTKSDYLRELTFFLNYIFEINKEDIRHLSRHDMETYQLHMEQKYLKSTTRAKKITIVRSFLEWCYAEGYLSKDLNRGLLPVKIDKNEIPEREITEESLVRAIQFFENNPKIKSLLVLLGTTGLRLNEVITPGWRDVTFDSKRQKYYLRSLTKGGKVRNAVIKDYVFEEIKEYRKRIGLSSEIDPTDTSPFFPNRFGKHYHLSSLSSYLSDQMKRAGLITVHAGRVTPHFLRHYFAQEAYDAGAPISFIAETLGHSMERTTKDNYLRKSMRKENDVSEFVDIHIPINNK